MVTRDPGDDIFELPGGRIDEGESVNDCVMRELREELNIDLSSVVLNYVHSEQVMHTRDNRMQMMIAFSMVLPEDICNKIQFSDEVAEMDWVDSTTYISHNYYSDAKRTLDIFFNK